MQTVSLTREVNCPFEPVGRNYLSLVASLRARATHCAFYVRNESQLRPPRIHADGLERLLSLRHEDTIVGETPSGVKGPLKRLSYSFDDDFRQALLALPMSLFAWQAPEFPGEMTFLGADGSPLTRCFVERSEWALSVAEDDGDLLEVIEQCRNSQQRAWATVAEREGQFLFAGDALGLSALARALREPGSQILVRFATGSGCAAMPVRVNVVRSTRAIVFDIEAATLNVRAASARDMSAALFDVTGAAYKNQPPGVYRFPGAQLRGLKGMVSEITVNTTTLAGGTRPAPVPSLAAI